jgi:hypothetical protein
METLKSSADVLFAPLVENNYIPPLQYCPITKEYCKLTCKWYSGDFKCAINEIAITLSEILKRLENAD